MSLLSIDATIESFMDDDTKDTIHIVPKNGADHENDKNCWCLPDIEEYEHTYIVTHYTEH